MFVGATASAQDMMSKKGTPILPESGDWSIGISANSFLNYAGNLMNGSNTAPNFDWVNNQVITGKMMKDANTAYRAQVRIGLGSTTLKNQEVDLDGDGASDIDSVEIKTSYNDITLGAGIQKYRGKGRLQGIYGAEAAISLGGGKTTWDTNDFSAESKQGGTFGIAVRGFIGAEYFFAPKMSLSGEFGWGIGLDSTGEGEDTVTSGGTTTTTKTGGASTFGIDTGNANGNISLNMYF